MIFMLWQDVLRFAFYAFTIGIAAGVLLGIIARLITWVFDIVKDFIG